MRSPISIGELGTTVTERGPDTVRGADVAFYSFIRLPKGPVTTGYSAAAPELVFEVLSPSDRWPEVLAKVGEYLKAGVLVVCVVDPQRQVVVVHDADDPGRTLTTDQELVLPEWVGGWRIGVLQLFE